MTRSAHMFSDIQLRLCQRRGAVLKRVNRKTGKVELKKVHFGCGKKTCPICQDKRKRMLMSRLLKVKWPPLVKFWTFTTDPKKVTRQEALSTINKRWHAVHRSLLRYAPGLRYFKVVEFTESGLPHIHLITDAYLPWHDVQRHLMSNLYGQVVEYKLIPRKRALFYATKYCLKSFEYIPEDLVFNGRMWTASNGLMPAVEYHSPEGSWSILWFTTTGMRLDKFYHYLCLHHLGRFPAGQDPGTVTVSA